MTAKHIAWFRFKDGVSDDRIDEHMRAVRTLADLVPAVSAIECGKSYTDRAAGLTHCIIVTLPDRESLPHYLEHPAHVPIAEALVRDIAELRVMDLTSTNRLYTRVVGHGLGLELEPVAATRRSVNGARRSPTRVSPRPSSIA